MGLVKLKTALLLESPELKRSVFEPPAVVL